MENGVKGVQQHIGMKQAERLFCFNKFVQTGINELPERIHRSFGRGIISHPKPVQNR
jgi:hypothetical protein